MSPVLRAYRYWSIIGWLLLLSVITLSLVHIEQPLELKNADKFEHVLAYGCLMYWWGMVQPARRTVWMVFLPLLGLALEGVQTLTAYRSLEWNDALANLLGVLVALALLATPAGHLLAFADRKLADRFNSRSP